MNTVKDICVIAVLMAWTYAGLCFGYAYWKSTREDDSGNGSGDTPTPYDIDPQRDPGDWWKHDREKV